LEEEEQSYVSRLSRALEPLQSELGLPQLLALFRIALEPGLSVNDLAERMGCPQQTASRYVAMLLGRYSAGADSDLQNQNQSKLDPLISQEISQADPRRRALFLSAQGRTLLRKMVSQVASGGKK
jgi:DNA-binding MarR family transcriptional regulator